MISNSNNIDQPQKSKEDIDGYLQYSLLEKSKESIKSNREHDRKKRQLISKQNSTYKSLLTCCVPSTLKKNNQKKQLRSLKASLIEGQTVEPELEWKVYIRQSLKRINQPWTLQIYKLAKQTFNTETSTKYQEMMNKVVNSEFINEFETRMDSQNNYTSFRHESVKSLRKTTQAFSLSDFPTKKPIMEPQDIISNRVMIESSLHQKQLFILYEVENHINNKDHPINIIEKYFTDKFSRLYLKFVDIKKFTAEKLKERIKMLNFSKLKVSETKAFETQQIFETINRTSRTKSFENLNIDNKDIEPLDFIEKVIHEVQQFIRLLNDLLNCFYMHQIDQDDLEVMSEDLYKLTTSYVLKGNVAKIVTVFERFHKNAFDKDIRMKYKVLQHITPQDVGIDNFLLLNNSSPMNDIATKQIRDSRVVTQENLDFGQMLQYHKKLYKQSEVEEFKIDMQPTSLFSKLPRFSDDIDENEIEQRLKQKPYLEAVRLLRHISEKQCPFEKLYLLNEVRRSVDQNIQKFWAGIQVSRDKLECGTDQFISIFMFIIIKAQVPDLFAQFDIIQKFSSDYVLYISKYGHTLMTIERALTRIKLLENDKLNEPNYIKNAIIQQNQQDLDNRRTRNMQSVSFTSGYNPFLFTSNSNNKQWQPNYEGSYASSLQQSLPSQQFMFEDM